MCAAPRSVLFAVLAVLAGSAVACGPTRPPITMDRDLPVEGWTEVTAPTFSIASGAGRARTRQLAEMLAVFTAVAQKVSGRSGPPPRVPARIYLFPDDDAYDLFRAPGAGGQLHSTPRGLFVLMTPDLAWARSILFHEYTHFLQAVAGELRHPIWYVEGFADFLGDTRIRGHRVIVGSPPEVRAAALNSAEALLPIESILGARTYAESGNVSLFYAQSWLLVHYLHAGHQLGFPDRLDQASRFLQELPHHDRWQQAFAASFDIQPWDLGAELVSYWQRIRVRGSIPALRMDARSLTIPSVSEAALPPADVAAELGALFLDPGSDTTRFAERLFERALSEDPMHARAWAGLARAHARLGDFDAARAEIDRALAQSPDDAEVWRALGRVRLRQSEAGEAPGESLEAAREAYRRAIALDPDAEAARVDLGRTYLGADGDVTPGIEALETARARIPWDNAIELDLAKLLLQAGSRDRAKARLLAVLRWSHGEERVEAARLLVELDEPAEG